MRRSLCRQSAWCGKCDTRLDRGHKSTMYKVHRQCLQRPAFGGRPHHQAPRARPRVLMHAGRGADWARAQRRRWRAWRRASGRASSARWWCATSSPAACARSCRASTRRPSARSSMRSTVPAAPASCMPARRPANLTACMQASHATKHALTFSTAGRQCWCTAALYESALSLCMFCTSSALSRSHLRASAGVPGSAVAPPDITTQRACFGAQACPSRRPGRCRASSRTSASAPTAASSTRRASSGCCASLARRGAPARSGTLNPSCLSLRLGAVAEAHSSKVGMHAVLTALHASAKVECRNECACRRIAAP